MKYVLKQLLPTSWILLGDGDRLGLVSQEGDRIHLIGKIEPKIYNSLEDLADHLGSDLTIELPADGMPEPQSGDIDGYPVKHAGFHNATTDPIATYTRTEKSEIRYAAGYYALKFPHGWTAALCPKIVTLGEYENIGPFRTKMEMQHGISMKNKVSNV
jgi:hypothetical protein